MNKQNGGHIIINIPTEGWGLLATDFSDQNQNIPLTTAPVGFNK